MNNWPQKTMQYAISKGIASTVRRWSVILVLSCTSVAGLFAQTGTAKKVDENKLKAVYMYSFGKYTTWPASTFAKTNNEVVVGVYGESPMLEHLQSVAVKRTLQNKKIRVVYFKSTEDYVPCHMVFVSGGIPDSEQRQLITKLNRRPVLLVGEKPMFNPTGGMVSFFLTDDLKVKFEIEVQNTKKSGLSLDAKLLRLGSKRPVILPPPQQTFETSNAPPSLPSLQR